MQIRGNPCLLLLIRTPGSFSFTTIVKRCIGDKHKPEHLENKPTLKQVGLGKLLPMFVTLTNMF